MLNKYVVTGLIVGLVVGAGAVLLWNHMNLKEAPPKTLPPELF